MKPFGRVNTVKGGNTWKIDHHIHMKGYVNWWETINSYLSRSRMKQIVKKEINKEINET